MAENLTKEILPIQEEQKQEKKPAYKNWKIYATALGIITVGLAVGLGAGLGAQHAHTVNVDREHDIATQINNTTYVLPNVINGDTAESIKQQITTDFIKTQLTSSNSKNFKANSFTLNSVTVTDTDADGKTITRDLADSDLTTDNPINAKMNYNYGASKNQVTNLTITISEKNQAAIVDAINAVTYTLVSNVDNVNSAQDIIDLITADYIKAQLSVDNQSSFVSDAFKLNSVTIDGTDLTDDDLIYDTTINTNINYSYGSSIDNTTKLAITVEKANDYQIISAINSTTFNLTGVTSGDTATDTSAKINNIIQNQLNKNIQSSFVIDSFTLTSITVADTDTDGNTTSHELTDSDLATYGTINATINYTYGSVDTNQTTNLTITVNASDSELIEAINNTSLKLTTITAGDSVDTLNINTFIKNSLTEGILQNSFNTESFTLTSITVADTDTDGNTTSHELADSDLATYGTINATINYTYGSVDTNQTTNLTITVNASDSELIEAINNTTYTIDAYGNDKAKNITDQITGEFIQKQLTEGILQNSFFTGSFALDTVTVGEDSHTLVDSDLTTYGTINAKINYQYGGKEKASGSTTLTININHITNDIMNNEIKNATFAINPDLASEAASITENVPNLIYSTLNEKSFALATTFISGLFKLNSITVISQDSDGNDASHKLADSDLIKIRTLNTQMSYTFNDVENTTSLTIVVSLPQDIDKNGLDISKLVTEENSHLTLEGVTTASSDNQIKQAIINALIPIIKDVLGDAWDSGLGALIEANIGTFIKITLNDTRTGATIEGANPLIKGTVSGTFELSDPVSNN